jgi:hypothetical protein
MCLHLTIVVPTAAVEQLHRVLPTVAPARPEPYPEIVAAIARGGECFSLGVQCACDLFRSGPTRAERIEKKAKRDHWSKNKLQRALQETRDDWSGLHPEVRDALAALAESIGTVSVFLFWDGRGGRLDVQEEREVDPDSFRSDRSLLVGNRLLVVRKKVG